MGAQLQLQGASIVLRGHFNPAIFHPSWFASHNLIRSQEAESADVQIVHPDTAVFRAEWLQVTVMRDRFQALTAQEAYYEPLRDIVVGVLGLVNHTPLQSMGLNRDFHFRVESLEARNNLGYRLVPRQDWDPVLKDPGMTRLIVKGKRPDEFRGYVQVEVAPSTLVEPGVYIQVNDHYELADGTAAEARAHDAVQILGKAWNESTQRGLEIAKAIAELRGPK